MTCQTRLLKDEPVKEDKFGSHQRVARAIAELLKSEEGGRAIGIEGAWGSGKSTVVNLVDQHLNSDGRFRMFIFDAWAHEGDPLRRSFLEELCKFLQKHHWITKSTADQLLSDLRERRARLSAWAVVFGTSVLLTSLGGALIERANGKQSHQFWIGVCVALAPFLVLLSYGFWRCLGGETAGGLVGAAIPNATSDNSAGPTSIEFSELFDGLMGHALTGRGHDGTPHRADTRKLVLVIDNLDRVDAASARAIWGTLQTFLCQKQHQWFRRLWVLVPYDPMRIDRWVGGGRTDGGREGFLSKSFAARFVVPPPILPSWKDFLLEKLHEAMPDHPRDDWHSVYRTFDACRDTNGDAPTLRELKEFVNGVGVIHRQWQDQLRMAHVACFVLTREVVLESKKGRLSFQERLQVGDQSLAPAWLRSQQLWADLADLWFNSSRGSGIELLLSTTIEQALTTGDGIRLQAVRQAHKYAADVIIEKVFDDLELPKPETVLLVGQAFAQVRLAGDFPKSETAMVQSWLRTNVRQVVAWKPEKPYTLGAIALIDFCGAEGIADVLIPALNQGLNQQQLVPGLVDEWVGNLLTFLADCYKIGVPIKSTVLTLLEGGNTLGAVWLNVMGHDPIGRFWGHLRVSDLTAERVIKDLVPLLNRAEPPADELLAAIVAIEDEKSSREWASIAEAIAAPLAAGAPTGEQQQLQLQWRTKWLWVLAQHGSFRSTELIVQLTPKLLTYVQRDSEPLAFGLAVEYLLNAGNDVGAKRKCEKIVHVQRHQDQFAAYLHTWEGGQRVVPFVRAVGQYPDDLRELVRKAATTNSRMMAHLREDLKHWAQATPSDPLLQQIASDAELSLDVGVS